MHQCREKKGDNPSLQIARERESSVPVMGGETSTGTRGEKNGNTHVSLLGGRSGGTVCMGPVCTVCDDVANVALFGEVHMVDL